MNDENQMKNVLAIAPYAYLPFFSGGQKYIARFFEHLASETQLTVVSVPGNDTSLANSYRLLPLLKSSFSRYADRSLVAKLVELVKQEGFDTLICEHPYFAWLVNAVKKRTGINIIIHTHNIEYQRFRSMGKWWWPVLKGYEKRNFKKADRLFFISPEDREFAVSRWDIEPVKCVDVPFGIELQQYPPDRAESRKIIADRHGIGSDEIILSFNGLLDYKPNIDALKVILGQINPLLMSYAGFRYKIIISGKNLAREFDSLEAYMGKNIIYTGFAEDIIPYLKATAIFLNPVMSGGGIKTKMVEAIGYGATVVSTETGAKGIERKICGEKLVVVPDQDWAGFTRAILDHSQSHQPTPPVYYEHYNWKQIIKKMITHR